MNIALFLPNWLGDVVMATPALRAIRRHFGAAARITGIVRPHLVELLAGSPWLDDLWRFDPHGAHARYGRIALVRCMRRAKFDLAVLFPNSLHVALLAWAGGARQRVGYARNLRGPLLTTKLYPPRDGLRIAPAPMVDSYLALAEAVGCPSESPRLSLPVTEAQRRAGEVAWRELGLRSDGRVVALNSNGAYGAAKVWPAEHCGTLARMIAQRLDHDVLVVCGPSEVERAREIVAHAAAPRVFSLARHAGLATTMGCLSRARLLVSTDSGPRHVAAALGRPVITLLGPTLPVWIDNATVAGSYVRTDLDCLGCGKRTCPLEHHRCMRDLAPQRVCDEVEKYLVESAERAA
jgi:heptosyltransferase II